MTRWLLLLAGVGCAPEPEREPDNGDTAFWNPPPAPMPCSDTGGFTPLAYTSVGASWTRMADFGLKEGMDYQNSVEAAVHSSEEDLRAWLEPFHHPSSGPTEPTYWSGLDLSAVDWSQEVVLMAFARTSQTGHAIAVIDVATLPDPSDLCVALDITQPEGGDDMPTSPWNAVTLPLGTYALKRLMVSVPRDPTWETRAVEP